MDPGLVVEAAEVTDVPLASANSRARLVWLRLRAMKRFWIGLTVLVLMVLWAFVGPAFSQWSITHIDVYNLDMGPTSRHWFGTNELGQDLYAQVMHGLQKSLVIGLVAGILCTALSAVIGAVTGYIGGITDRVVTWFIDLFLVLPSFFLLVICYPVFHGSWIILTFFLALTGWMVMAQTVRMQTRALREREFVKAARYMGFGTWQVVRRHVIPNVISLLIIDASLNVGAMILSETALSFFGFGVQAPDVSLGTLLDGGWTSATTRPWLFVFPAGALIVLLLSINLIGDALRDALDPTSGANRD